MRLAILVPTGLLVGVLLSACQSTQATSAALAQKGDKLLGDKALEIGKANTDVEVVSATVLSGPDTAAVAVELRNNSDAGQINVPIQIDVKDAKGKTVFKNDSAGTDPTLIAVPVIGAGEEVWWVHDQVFAVKPPKSVEVEVGTGKPLPALPEIQASEPRLIRDSISGLDEATGEVENHSDEELKQVYVYAVATKGDKVVAAGRGAIDKLKLDPPKPAEYNVFLTGDPIGAELSVNATPTFLKE